MDGDFLLVAFAKGIDAVAAGTVAEVEVEFHEDREGVECRMTFTARSVVRNFGAFS